MSWMTNSGTVGITGSYFSGTDVARYRGGAIYWVSIDARFSTITSFVNNSIIALYVGSGGALMLMPSKW